MPDSPGRVRENAQQQRDFLAPFRLPAKDDSGDSSSQEEKGGGGGAVRAQDTAKPPLEKHMHPAAQEIFAEKRERNGQSRIIIHHVSQR
jgi:hypothetical protein